MSSSCTRVTTLRRGRITIVQGCESDTCHYLPFACLPSGEVSLNCDYCTHSQALVNVMHACTVGLGPHTCGNTHNHTQAHTTTERD